MGRGRGNKGCKGAQDPKLGTPGANTSAEGGKMTWGQIKRVYLYEDNAGGLVGWLDGSKKYYDLSDLARQGSNWLADLSDIATGEAAEDWAGVPSYPCDKYGPGEMAWHEVAAIDVSGPGPSWDTRTQVIAMAEYMGATAREYIGDASR